MVQVLFFSLLQARWRSWLREIEKMAGAGSLPSSIQAAQVQDEAARWRSAKASARDQQRQISWLVDCPADDCTATPVTLTGSTRQIRIEEREISRWT